MSKIITADQAADPIKDGDTLYNPGLAGHIKMPLASLPPMPFSERKVMARRAAIELAPHAIVNLGIGIPDGVASVAAEEGVADLITLTNGAEREFRNGKVRVVSEGKTRKFVERVDQITFSGKFAQRNGIPVLYITERAVFRLQGGEVTLIEIAPGLDLERDVLAAMDFRPHVSPSLREMPAELFAERWGGLKQVMAARAQ